MDRSGLGGKSGEHLVYNFFITAAALSMLICISILQRSVGKRNRGWKTLLTALSSTYIGARQEEALGRSGICDYRILLHI